MSIFITSKLKYAQVRDQISKFLPGFILCLMVAMAASFLSEHYGGPAILYGLLLGMALNYLSKEGLG